MHATTSRHYFLKYCFNMKTVFTITATLNAGSLCRVIYLFIYLLTLQPFIHDQCRRQALKYILQGRLTKCPMTLSLGRTYVR